MKTEYFKQDEFVFKEGDLGEDFFIIEEGAVDCLKLKTNANESTFEFVRRLNSGDHFGELALINSQQRSLSIRVSSAEGAKLHRLGQDAFKRILGSIEKYLKKDYGRGEQATD
jgi:cAMP-dependent protein kinase regulator